MPGYANTITKLHVLLIGRQQRGGTSDELALALGLSRGHVCAALTEATMAGLLETWPEPRGCSKNRKRHYAAGHRPTRPPQPLPAAPRKPYKAPVVHAAVQHGKYAVTLPSDYKSALNPLESRPWAALVAR